MIATPTDPRQSYFDKYEEHRFHLTALLEANIITLDLRPRLLYPLWSAGVRTVGDLLGLHRSRLLAIRGIGVAAVDEIERILIRADLLHLNSRVDKKA